MEPQHVCPARPTRPGVLQKEHNLEAVPAPPPTPSNFGNLTSSPSPSFQLDSSKDHSVEQAKSTFKVFLKPSVEEAENGFKLTFSPVDPQEGTYDDCTNHTKSA